MTEKSPAPPKETPKFLVYRMRCGREVRVPDTPVYRENAKRQRWTLVR